MCLPSWVHYEALNKRFPCVFFRILHATVWHLLGAQLSKCCGDERGTHFLFSGNVCWAFPTGLKLSGCEAEAAVGSRPLNVHLPTAALSWVLPLVLQMWIGFLTIWFKLLHVSCYSWELLIAQGCLLVMLNCQDVAWNLGRGKSLLDGWSIKDRLKKKKNRKEHPSDRRKKISFSATGIFLFLLFFLLFHITFNTQHLIIAK